MSVKMKANPGSDRVWNFIMGVFRGAAPGALHQSSKKFLQSSIHMYCLASAADSDTVATAVSSLQLAVAAASSFQTSIPTAGHPTIRYDSGV